MTDWRKIASQYKAQHEKDTNQIARLVADRFKRGVCTCRTRPGAELRTLGQTLQKLAHNDDIKRMAAEAFEAELVLQKLSEEKNES